MTMQMRRYAERIDRVLEYLERREAGEGMARLEDAAAVAAISPFHFHRIFRLMTGETLFECQQRIRLARSLPAIGDAGQTIATAAMSAGYATGQSYARALKSRAGVSGTELRADPATLSALEETLSRRKDPPAEASAPLEIAIVEVEPLRLVALRNVGAYGELFSSYERLLSQIVSAPGYLAITAIYGVHVDDARSVPPGELRFDCAFGVDGLTSLPDGTRRLDVPARSCLAARHTGDYDALLDTVDALYCAAINRAIELKDAPLIAHYLDDPAEVAAKELRTDLYLPLGNHPDGGAGTWT